MAMVPEAASGSVEEQELDGGHDQESSEEDKLVELSGALADLSLEMVADGDNAVRDLSNQIELLGADCPPDFIEASIGLRKGADALQDMLEEASGLIKKKLRSC